MSACRAKPLSFLSRQDYRDPHAFSVGIRAQATGAGLRAIPSAISVNIAEA